MEGMLTLKEVVEYLEMDQGRVEKLVRKGKLDAYNIGGAFLRFDKEQVMSLKKGLRSRKKIEVPAVISRSRDFWYFNRIYILSAILFGLVLYVFVK